MRLNILQGSNPSTSKILEDTRIVNFYTINRNGKLSLKAWPGLKEVGDSDIGTSAARGGLLFGTGSTEWDRYFVYVKGSTVAYHDTSDDSSTAFTPILNTLSGIVPIAVAGNHIMLVDGDAGYYFDRTATLSALTTISDADFPADPRYCTSLDGYFIVDDPANEGKFQISAFEDASAWAALDFATAQKIEDDLKWIDNDGLYLWLFGSYSTEIWQNTGNPDFPFEPINNININVGVQASASVAKIHATNSFVFLGRTSSTGGKIFLTKGFSVQPISTPDLEQEINNYDSVTDAKGQIFYWNGILFYIITFSSNKKSWVYNFTTNSWTELENLVSGSVEKYPGQIFLYANKVPYVITDTSDKVCKLDKDTYTNISDSMVRTIETPIIETEDGSSILYSAIELEFEPGVGDNTTLEPEVSLEWSDDYGNTWSNKHYKKLGSIGKYENRVIYRNLGRAIHRKFRVIVSDPVSVILKGIMLQSNLGERKLTINANP